MADRTHLAAVRGWLARWHPVPIGALAAAALLWFLVGLYLTAEIGHVDFPCRFGAAHSLGETALRAADGADAVALISVYPARLGGGGCSVGTLDDGGTVTVEGITVRLEGDTVDVRTAGAEATLDVTERRLRDARGEPPDTALSREWTEPAPGYPFVYRAESRSVAQPVRFVNETDSVVVVSGAVAADHEVSWAWVLALAGLLVLVPVSLVVRAGQWLRGRR